MLDIMAMGLFKLVSYSFGMFIIIAIGYTLMMGKQREHTGMIRFIGGLLISCVHLVVEFCGNVGRRAAQGVNPQYRNGVARLVQVTLAAVIIAGALYIANDQLPPHTVAQQYQPPQQYQPDRPQYNNQPQYNPPPSAPQGLQPYVPPYQVPPTGRR